MSVDLAAVEARLTEIRARSTEIIGGLKVWCGSCEMSFFHGVRHPDGGGYPCPKHVTDEERAAVEAAMSAALRKAPLTEQPFFAMLRRPRAQ